MATKKKKPASKNKEAEAQWALPRPDLTLIEISKKLDEIIHLLKTGIPTHKGGVVHTNKNKK